MDGSWGRRILARQNVSRAGLILTGGGARAAYQVGVLKALAEIHAEPRMAVSHHRGNVGRRRFGQHPGGQCHALASVGGRNRESLGEFPRGPGVPLRRRGHAQSRRPLDGFPVHRRHDRPAEIAARQLAAARAAVQGRRISTPSARNVARGDLRALALCATSYFTARSVSFFEAETTISEWSQGATPRRARAAVARLPDGQPRHSVPVSADVPARRVLRRRRDAPDRAAVVRRFTSAPIACWCWACGRRTST